MDSHPIEAVAILREIAGGVGGRVLIVSGSEIDQFYAGIHRKAASTLLEAVLTFVKAGVYEEILLVAGRGNHLPALPIGPQVKLGATRTLAYLLRKENPATIDQTAATPVTGSSRFLRADRSRQRAVSRVELDVQNMDWKDRLPSMFERIERLCEVNHLGGRHDESVTSIRPRRLILIDAEFLIPDAVTWHGEIAREQSEKGHIPARFARLPEIIAGTSNDLILLARDEREASSLELGNLISRRLPQEAERVEQFRFQWKDIPRLRLPGSRLSEAFGEYYTEPLPLAYSHFQSVPPINPTISRVMPPERMTADEIFRRLRKEVIGHDEAMRKIADRIESNLANRSQGSTKPIACILLPGPTGSGKTETAKALAKALFGRQDDHFIEIGMNEHQMTAGPLLGLTAGYVGYNEDWRLNGHGLLTKPLIQHPERYFVILLDELEKGHSDSANILFRAFDEGRATDASSGHIVSFRKTIFVATTNTADREIQGMADSGEPWERIAEQAHALLTSLGPATWKASFLARFDCILPLCYPTKIDLIAIARKLTRRLIESGDGHHQLVSVSEDFLAEVCAAYTRELGIRQLEKEIEKRLAMQLSGINREGRTSLLLTVVASGELRESEGASDAVAAVGA